jgi:hypothetical protein
MSLGTEAGYVHVRRVLPLRRRFPLVTPDNVPPGALETDPESTDASEELDDALSVGKGCRVGRNLSVRHDKPSRGRLVSELQ